MKAIHFFLEKYNKSKFLLFQLYLIVTCVFVFSKALLNCLHETFFLAAWCCVAF